jgi:uncharacterized protein with HEPN domain
MRRDKLYLADIVEAADAVAAFLAGAERERFLQDDLLRSAVLQKLSIIGEAAARLSKEFRDRHADVEWRDIVAFRNIAVHAYFAVQWSIVWTTATQDVPVLRQKISQILAAEYPDDASPKSLF